MLLRIVLAALAYACVCAPLRAASNKELARVDGRVAFQTGSDATLHPLFGSNPRIERLVCIPGRPEEPRRLRPITPEQGARRAANRA